MKGNIMKTITRLLMVMVLCLAVCAPASADRFFGRDFALEVAKGNIPGHSSVNKFGMNGEVDSGVVADIWDRGSTGGTLIWVAPTQSRTHTIASPSPVDTGGGAGARTVRIWGLVDWDTAEVSEDITMDFASPPVTVNSYVIIHRMQVLTKGSNNSNAGIITATATTDGTVTAQITNGKGQTLMAIYGIPSTQTFYLTDLYGSMNKASGVGASTGYINVSLLVNPEPQDELLNFVVKHVFGLSLDGNSSQEIDYGIPKIIAGPAIIKAQAASGTADIDVSAGFDGFLVDN